LRLAFWRGSRLFLGAGVVLREVAEGHVGEIQDVVFFVEKSLIHIILNDLKCTEWSEISKQFPPLVTVAIDIATLYIKSKLY
jgi:hypothetical protein